VRHTGGGPAVSVRPDPGAREVNDRANRSGVPATEAAPLGPHTVSEWETLLMASKLPATARLIGFVIAHYARPHGDQGVWLSQADMARATGLTTATVRYHLDDLTGRRWITTAGPGQPRYLAWPEPGR